LRTKGHGVCLFLDVKQRHFIRYGACARRNVLQAVEQQVRCVLLLSGDNSFDGKQSLPILQEGCGDMPLALSLSLSLRQYACTHLHHQYMRYGSCVLLGQAHKQLEGPNTEDFLRGEQLNRRCTPQPSTFRIQRCTDPKFPYVWFRGQKSGIKSG
jgi:hypothetical protein